MSNKIVILMFLMSLLLVGFVFAGPFFDFTVVVNDLSDNAVENADVHFFIPDNNHFDFEGTTNADGEFVFEIDARVWIPINSSINSYYLTNSGNNEIPFSLSKECDIDEREIINLFEAQNNEVISKNCRETLRNILFSNKTFTIEIEPGNSLEFENLETTISTKIDDNYVFEYNVNLEPQFNINDLNDITIEEDVISTIDLSQYLDINTIDNDYYFQLDDDAPPWVSIDSDDLVFDLQDNADPTDFSVMVKDVLSDEGDDIGVYITNIIN